MSTEADFLWPAGYDRIVLEETDSTMREAARLAPTLTQPTWILAHHQTAAHGRRGRPWANPAGNFAATLVMRPDCTPAEAALRSFVAAIALYWTLGSLIDRARLTLKWPNDVLLDSGKVAGILLESSGRGQSVDWLSIGIGINLAAAPDPAALEPGAVAPVSIAGQGGQAAPADEVLTELALHFDQHDRILRETGFDPIRRLWLRHAARLGETVTAKTTRDSFTGTFDTVDETGQLILRTAAGPVIIPAADIYF